MPVLGRRSQNTRSLEPSNADWWPNQTEAEHLAPTLSKSDPMGEEFNYAEEFKSLDLNAVVKDLHALMTDSQAWWPADSATTDLCSFAWHGTAPARTASATVAAAQGAATSALLP